MERLCTKPSVIHILSITVQTNLVLCDAGMFMSDWGGADQNLDLLALHFLLFRFVSFSFGIQLTALFCADRNVLLQWDDT
jgi:hypothetical protein